MELEAGIRRDVERIFGEKRRRLEVDAKLDLHVETVEAPPIVDENVYGEAFPFEKPPRVWMEVFPEATTREITKIVCEELLHIKHPGLSEEEVGRMVPACVGDDPETTACEARWSDEPNLLYPHSVVQLRPQAFLDLCPPLPYTHENLKSMVADVVEELKTKGRYKPFFKVNLSGQVLDHEGRIRAIAAKRLGCWKIPMEVYFYDEEYREYLKPPKKLPPLEPQRWREFHIRRGKPVPPVHTFYMAGLMVRVLGAAGEIVEHI
ncbi:hypothetical protein ES703_88612 [subsurface metagenome]